MFSAEGFGAIEGDGRIPEASISSRTMVGMP